MPDMDGIDAATRLYQEAPVPVILVSAYHDPELVERAMTEWVELPRMTRAEERTVALEAEDHSDLRSARRHMEPRTFAQGLRQFPQGVGGLLGSDGRPDGADQQ